MPRRVDPAGADPAFPRLHGRPARGWLNDPNGLCWIDGRYHVFFQYNPHSSRHEAIAWGHASSADLVRWRQEPIALVSRPGELDAFGCWSGCMVEDGGVPTAVYSGVLDDQGHSAVLLARGDRDLRAWQQGREPAAGMPEGAGITDTRDPFVFEYDGHRYALQGAGNRRGDPQVLLYACDDLTSWTLLGPFLTVEDPVAAGLTAAQIWECPNLVQIDGRWVLIVSLWRTVAGEVVLDQVRYLVGDLVPGPAGPVFGPHASGVLDTGPCFYAPQVLVRDGRVLLWGWSSDRGRPASDVVASGWAGTLTFARELSLDGDVVVSRPAAELTGLRDEELEIAPGRPFDASAFELQTEGRGTAMSLSLMSGSGERMVAAWEPSGRLETPVRVLVDGSIVEVFDGGPAHTTRAYPSSPTDRWLVRSDDPDAAVRGWRLA